MIGYIMEMINNTRKPPQSVKLLKTDPFLENIIKYIGESFDADVVEMIDLVESVQAEYLRKEIKLVKRT